MWSPNVKISDLEQSGNIHSPQNCSGLLKNKNIFTPTENLCTRGFALFPSQPLKKRCAHVHKC